MVASHHPEHFGVRFAQEVVKNHPDSIRFLIADNGSSPEEKLVHYVSQLPPAEQEVLFARMFDEYNDEVFDGSYMELLRALAPTVIFTLREVRSRVRQTSELQLAGD